MLDLSKVDLRELGEALEDNSESHGWWLDPQTGEVEIWLEDDPDREETDPDDRGLIYVEPIGSRDAYEDLEDFSSRVRDPRAREHLERAISGRGAFRRFKDALFEHPDLRELWFRFHDTRMERRSIEWLAEHDLVERDAAERALATRPDPDLPEISGPFDAESIARAVASDLKGLYGDRLRSVLLFGSWARGDAHDESDIDLLVVLDAVDDVSRWDENDRMDDILWKHSYSNDTVVDAFPVSQEDFDHRRLPLLINARKDGVEVA